MKRFTPGASSSGWTRRGTIMAAAGLAACGNSPEAGRRSGPHPLWPRDGPPVLRGAVIAQRRRRIEIDGATFGGEGAALPAYRRSDFDALAAAGANLVVMSFPELWTVGPPWRRDQQMADILLRQLDDARAAGLYAVVALRSGPGRSDFVFHRDAAGGWFPASLVIDSVWREADAQQAWIAMCADAARFLKGRDEIAGLNIMVEPDPNAGGLNRDGLPLGAWTPADYLAQVSPLSDWKRLAGEAARAVRAVSDVPVLISPPAFARTEFLPVMGAPPVANTVWCIHDYEPRQFTHHPQNSAGQIAFTDEGSEGFVARVDAVKAGEAPVFLGEFGASRWASGVGAYYAARIAACEERAIAWAAFRWPTQDAAYETSDAMFSVTHGGWGDEPAAVAALRLAWARNMQRPAKAHLHGGS